MIAAKITYYYFSEITSSLRVTGVKADDKSGKSKIQNPVPAEPEQGFILPHTKTKLYIRASQILICEASLLLHSVFYRHAVSSA